MAQRLKISGIRAQGRHGARPGERDSPQPFVVDLELDVDAHDDDLATTADYRDVIAAVRGIVEGESYSIIETIVERVVDVIAAYPGVRGVIARVHKPAAADRLGVADVLAEAAAGSLS
ncbi:MAG TPA: dihydroneopterin aldolase [Actinomycetota bacterium]|nr:dihydroneopterin aldolase [Actinomycetota bacterium]